MDQKRKNPKKRSAAPQAQPVRTAAVTRDEEERRPRRRRAEPTNNELILFYRRMMRRLRRAVRRLQELRWENQERNFPESDHRVPQLVLFVWNILPMLFSLLNTVGVL